MALTDLFHPFFIDVEDAPCPPVYVRWLAGGTFNYWCFGFKQIIGVNTIAENTFEKYLLDLQDERTRDQIIEKSLYDSILVGYDNLRVEKIKGLKTLLSSVSVQMLISEPQVRPTKWMTVNIDGGSWDIYETNVDCYNLELKIILPKRFNETLR